MDKSSDFSPDPFEPMAETDIVASVIFPLSGERQADWSSFAQNLQTLRAVHGDERVEPGFVLSDDGKYHLGITVRIKPDSQRDIINAAWAKIFFRDD